MEDHRRKSGDDYPWPARFAGLEHPHQWRGVVIGTAVVILAAVAVTYLAFG